MKKGFAIILIFLFLINDFSFISIYMPLISLVRYINSETKDFDIEDPDITTIILSKSDFYEENRTFRKIDEDEIIFENELYDVRSYKEVNDSVLIYCVKDTKENSLDRIFTTRVDQDKGKNISKTFHNILNNKRFTAYLKINHLQIDIVEITAFRNDNADFIFTPFLKIEIPPPKFS